MKKKIKRVVVSGMIATTIAQSFTGNAANWAKINNEWNYILDETLFCHGGLTESFVIQHFGYGEQDMNSIISKINSMGKEDLWKDNSPL